MSKLETPMIRAYWRQIGGTLIEEFPVVKGSATCGPRRPDAVILPDGEHRIAQWLEVDVNGRDVIVIQAKAHRQRRNLCCPLIHRSMLIAGIEAHGSHIPKTRTAPTRALFSGPGYYDVHKHLQQRVKECRALTRMVALAHE